MDSHSFDLERSVASWRQFILSRQPHMDADQREELEQHLRDAWADYRAQGLSDWDAFSAARKSIGHPERMEAAYQENYWRSVSERGSLATEFQERLRLIRNQLTLAIRAARKRPLQTVVNGAGLSVGLACCLLISLFVWHQSTFDRFHENGDRIFRIATDYRIDSDVIRTAETVGPLLPVLLESIPEIEQGVRMSMGSIEVKRDLVELQSNRVLFADSGFFDVFTYPLARGDERTALQDPLGVILTTPMAERLFGSDDPLGQTLMVDDAIEVHVTGVLAPLPDRSHMQFEILASTEALRMMEEWIFSNWWSFYFHSYVRLQPGADASLVEGAMTRTVRERAEPELIRRDPGYALALEPLTDIYLRSDRTGQLGLTGSPSMLRLFSIVGLLILLIAVANFVNLATALSLGRAREIGIRKVVGGDRRQLSRQFMGESFLMVGLSAVIALAMSRLFLPVINALTGVPLSLDSVDGRVVALILGVLVIGTSLLAGWYPARLMSRIPAAPVLSGQLPGHLSRGQFRRISVVLQFAISFVLIAATMIVGKQLSLLATADQGFTSEGLLSMDFSNDDKLGAQPITFRDRVAGLSGVEAASLSSALPGDAPLGEWNMDFQSPAGDIVRVSFPHLLIDEQFLETWQIPLVAGRNFRDDIGADDTRALILNESAVRQLGFDNPDDVLGIHYEAYPDGGEVIGVARDFHFTSMRSPIGAIAMRYMANRFGHLTVRTQMAGIQPLTEKMESVWYEMNHEKAFNVRLVDDVLMAQYGQDQRFGALFRWASASAILIALMGLFAQITLSLRMRSREIGVRRVMGASQSSLAFLLSREVVSLTALACVIGIPLTWIPMTAWLSGFTIHITPSPTEFILASLLTVGVAFSTIFGLTLRASRLNPVDVLRTE